MSVHRRPAEDTSSLVNTMVEYYFGIWEGSGLRKRSGGT